MNAKVISALLFWLVAGLCPAAQHPPTWGPDYQQYGDLCPQLENENHPALLHYLVATTPNDSNKYCVAWAIYNMEDTRYERAIPRLIQLLDFRRPETPLEERTHVEQHIMWPYPAESALRQIAVEHREKVLSALLRVLKGSSASPISRKMSVLAWMQIYEQFPDGVAALKQQEMKAHRKAVRQRLQSAVQQGLTFCTSLQRSDLTSPCEQAAKDGVVPR